MNFLGRRCLQCDVIPVFLEKSDVVKIFPVNVMYYKRVAEAKVKAYCVPSKRKANCNKKPVEISTK